MVQREYKTRYLLNFVLDTTVDSMQMIFFVKI
jgi:hypothetical protein